MVKRKRGRRSLARHRKRARDHGHSKRVQTILNNPKPAARACTTVPHVVTSPYW